MPSRFTKTCWLRGWFTRAFQSWANRPFSPRIPSVICSVRSGPKDLELVPLADALVPAAQKEAGIVDVMVEMVVSEKEVVNLGRE